MILRENSKGLSAGNASVVATFGGLDSFRCFGHYIDVRHEAYDRIMSSFHIPEHLGLEGYLPLVLEVAGSRVAVTAAARVRIEIIDVVNILSYGEDEFSNE
jgi:hypothetical protein